MLKYKCCDCKRSFVVNSPGGKRDLYKKDTDKKKEEYRHGADEGHLQQRWFSLGPEAEIHPSQNHCHSGSRGGSGPVAHKTNSAIYSKS